MTDRRQARAFVLAAVAFYALMIGVYWKPATVPAPARPPADGPAIAVPSLGVLDEIVFVSRCAGRYLGPPAWVLGQITAAVRAWAGAGGC